MMAQNRIKYFAEAVYTENSELEKLLKRIIDKTVATEVLENKYYEYASEAEEYKNRPTDYKKDLLINNLEDSMNFANTHEVIKELKKMQDFSETQVMKILQAALNNSQIRSIINDADVHAFYLEIVKNVKFENEVVDDVKRLLNIN